MEKVQSRELPWQLIPNSQQEGGGGGGEGTVDSWLDGSLVQRWQLGTCENACACQCILDSPKWRVGVKVS